MVQVSTPYCGLRRGACGLPLLREVSEEPPPQRGAAFLRDALFSRYLCLSRLLLRLLLRLPFIVGREASSGQARRQALGRFAHIGMVFDPGTAHLKTFFIAQPR